MIQIKLQKKLNAPEGKMLLDLQLEFPSGSLITLYGPSGAGKTSSLRILAGLIQADYGKISVNNKVWLDTDQRICIKPQERKTGFVFQDYALFPNMTVRQNLEFAAAIPTSKWLGNNNHFDAEHLRASWKYKFPKSPRLRYKNQQNGFIDELIEIIELGDLQHQNPNTLSGGQQQRLALARALAQKPEILLLDEPLSAQDSKIRVKLQNYLLHIHNSSELTTILISHDIGEIHKLSDLVFVLDKGKLVQQGNPVEVFSQGNERGEFKFKGEVLSIDRQASNSIVSVLIHQHVIELVVSKAETTDLSVGDQVVVVSKSFNPVIYKAE